MEMISSTVLPLHSISSHFLLPFLPLAPPHSYPRFQSSNIFQAYSGFLLRGCVPQNSVFQGSRSSFQAPTLPAVPRGSSIPKFLKFTPRHLFQVTQLPFPRISFPFLLKYSHSLGPRSYSTHTHTPADSFPTHIPPWVTTTPPHHQAK